MWEDPTLTSEDKEGGVCILICPSHICLSCIYLCGTHVIYPATLMMLKAKPRAI